MSLIVAEREFRRILISKMFLLATFGMPFFIVAYLLFFSGFTYFASKMAVKETLTGFVDYSPLTGESLKEILDGSNYQASKDRVKTEDDKIGSKLLEQLDLKIFHSMETARKALLEHQITGIIFIDKDFLSTGTVSLYSRSNGSLVRELRVRSIDQFLFTQLVQYAGLQPDLEDRLLKPLEFKEIMIEPDGSITSEEEEGWRAVTERLVSKGGAFLLAGIIVFVLLGNASRFSQSMARERESKLIDILLSSVSPDALIRGKVLGIVAASLIQMIIWLAIAITIPAILVFSYSIHPSLNYDLARIFLSIVIAITGMIFYGLIITGFGATNSDPNESLPITRVLSAVMGLIFGCFLILLTLADSFWWRIASVVPFLTPFLVPMQLAGSEYSTLEGLLFLIYLLFWTMVASKFAGRILRLGVMLDGQQPGYFQVMRMFFDKKLWS